MPISERKRLVKASVRCCGRSALSVPGEDESCVVRTDDFRYRVRECRRNAEFRWYRGIIIALKRIRFRAFPFLYNTRTGENKMKELPKVYDPKSVEKNRG